MQTPLDSLLSYVRTLDLPERITGSDLAALIRLRFPDFKPSDYDCQNLKEFVAKFLPEIAVIGRNGMDCLYGRTSASETVMRDAGSVANNAALSEAGSSAAAIWKTFASPRTSYKLYGNTKTGELKVLFAESATLEDPWRRIPSCTAGIHVEIAQEFVNSLPDDAFRQELGTCIGQQDWWITFYQKVREHGLGEQWTRLRRDRILGELRTTLRKAGVPATRLPRAPAKDVRPVSNRELFPKGAGQDSSADTLRRIATALINRMSSAELRRLSARLGDILD
jgi:hypothetical protein